MGESDMNNYTWHETNDIDEHNFTRVRLTPMIRNIEIPDPLAHYELLIKPIAFPFVGSQIWVLTDSTLMK